MSNQTRPVFVVGSGRSGTRTIFKMLSGVKDVEIYHEFVCTHIQKAAAMYYMRLISKDEIKKELMQLHGSSIFYSKQKVWMDCSNKLSWVIEPILELFPDAKFINLVRDGRKVASSFFHKLNAEMYDDESVRTMENWLKNRGKLPVPPPEKKYWWNVPQEGQPFHKEFPSFSQFEKACYHWVESNRVIIGSFKNTPKDQQLTIKLEDLTSDKDVLDNMLDFIGIESQDKFFDLLKTPQNVFFPMDFKLSDEQLRQFDRIAGDMMKILGYSGKEEYRVKY